MLLTPPAPGSPRGSTLLSSVSVMVVPRAATAADDHEVLRNLVARLTGLAPARVALRQVCPACGLAGHGPLTVGLGPTAATDARLADAVHVSLSRADGWLALAVTGAGLVGIDLESVAALARSPLDSVLCSPAEAAALAELPPDAADSARARLWTSKEAVLKAAGVGLRVDPRDLTVAVAVPAGAARAAGTAGMAGTAGTADADGHVLAAWPRAPFPREQVQLLSVPAPAGLVATVAVICPSRPELRLTALD